MMTNLVRTALRVRFRLSLAVITLLVVAALPTRATSQTVAEYDERARALMNHPAVQAALDVIEELPQTVRRELVYRERSGERQGAAPAQANLFEEQASPTGKKTLALLRIDEALHIDEIIRTVRGESPADVLAALSELELFGSVKQLPGKSFVLAWRD